MYRHIVSIVDSSGLSYSSDSYINPKRIVLLEGHLLHVALVGYLLSFL